MKKILLLLCCTIAALCHATIPVPALHHDGFIENKGQLIDQSGQPNPDALYLYTGCGLHVQLRKQGFSYEILRTDQEGNNPLNVTGESPALRFHRVDVTFAGSNADAQIVASGAAPVDYNYYTTGTPENGAFHVRQYQRVVYRDVYPHIDVEFLVRDGEANETGGGFKYNFIVHPEGNINNIRLLMEGAEQTSLTKEGNILMETSLGNISERIPESYQFDDNGSKHKVETQFSSTKEGDFVIMAGEFDATLDLVIDPTPWCTYLGGTGNEILSAVKVDSAGNIYAAGQTSSTSNIATSGAYQGVFNGGTKDVLLARFNAIGTPVWVTYYGGSGDDGASGIAIDNKGSIIIVGSTTSSTNMTSTGAHKTTYDGSEDALIAKFTSAGARVWSTYYGGTAIDRAYEVTTDQQNNIVFCGWTFSGSGIATPGAYDVSRSGVADGFFAKMDSGGTRLWGTYYANDGGVDAIVADGGGNIYITGSTPYGIAASAGAYQSGYGGGNADTYLAKFTPAGTRIWATNYGGSATDDGSALALDRSGNIYLSGYSGSTTSIASTGAYQTVYGGGASDGFLVKFDTSGVRKWATYFGGNGDDVQVAATVDTAGNIITGGYTTSTNGIATYGCAQFTFGGGTNNDGYLGKFNANGQILWGTYLGGAALDGIHAMSTDMEGNVIIAGLSLSDSVLATPGAYQYHVSGGYDGLLASFSPAGVLYPPVTNNLISADQFICPKALPVTLTGTTPSGGNGRYTYRWLRSTTSATTGFSKAGGNDSAINFSPPRPSVNTWYKRVVMSGGPFDTSATVAISLKLIADFTINKTGQCLSGNVFSFNDISSIATGTLQSRLWNFGAGAGDTASLATPSKTYSAIGNFSVKLVVMGTSGCKDSITKTVSVGNKPSPGFTINKSNQCFKNNYFYVGDTSKVSSGPLTRTWYFGTGPNDTSTGNYIGKTYLTAGTYSIKLISASYGCTDSLTRTVIVNPQPVPGFRQNSLTQCLKGNSFAFIDTSSIASGSYARKWSFSATAPDTSVLANPVKAYAATGSYNVKLVLTSDSLCKDSVTKAVLVNPSSLAGFTVNKLVACFVGNSFNFADTSKLASSRMWYFGNGDSTTLASPAKSYALPGQYTVKLVAKQPNGCNDTAAKTLVVSQPRAGFTINDTMQCMRTNLFLLTDTTSSVSTRQWNFGDLSTGTSATANKTYAAAGTYTVKLKITDTSACSDSTTRNVTVKPVPVKPVITRTGTQLQSTPASAYQWYLNSTSISGATAQTHTFTSNGMYQVKADSTNGCNNMSDSFNVVNAGIAALSEVNKVMLFPNPACSELFVALTDHMNSPLLVVMDAAGRNVMEVEVHENAGNKIRLDISRLEEGMYFVMLGDTWRKFVIAR